MMEKKNKIKGMLQVILLVGSVFAFAYILNEFDGEEKIIVEKKSFGLGLLKLIVSLIFSEKTLVSAQSDLESSDLTEGVHTCLVDVNGAVCQEFPASQCQEQCGGECFNANRENTAECKIGTCYDPDFGTCDIGAPKSQCEGNGGQWFDDVNGNVPECQKRCCVYGNDVKPLVTERECEKIGEVGGVVSEFKPEIWDELSCLALRENKIEGACVVGDETRRCQFVSEAECIQKGGEFFEGVLCSHPDLDSGCERQVNAECVEGKDQIYWFDSCGNRENIYDSNRARNWNEGRVLSVSESCELGRGGDALANQGSCGNCNYLLGSSCGQKTNSEKLADNSLDVVCRDVRCIDSSGNVRENGESWCEYQGRVGMQESSYIPGQKDLVDLEEGSGFLRSAETPGSRHFRATCFDGEVVVNPCADYRNEICVENQAESSSGIEFSSAACVTNLWQLCLNYNSEVEGEGEERTRSIEKRNEQCLENPHCMLKKVDVADQFKFDLCVPKYSPGFDLRENAEGGELSCAFANQKCTVVYVKRLSGWKAQVNKGCLREHFGEQMNDLCMSLGDCGASVNYQGDFTENYKIYKSPRLDEEYISEISSYSDVKEGEYIEVGDVDKYFDAIGGIELLGGRFDDPTPEGLQAMGTIAGLSGGLAFYSGAVSAWQELIIAELVKSGPIDFVGSALAGAAGALAGAAIGFAVTSLLIQITGIGAGLDEGVTWALIGSGATAGLVLGYTATTTGLFTFSGAACAGICWAPIIGWFIAFVVITIIVVFEIIGIGDTKKKIVEFQCQPWQAELGGTACGECGNDGFPCSKYACQSLGQTCELINEGTDEEKCVDMSPNDITSPKISPLRDVLSEEFDYQDVSDSGFKVVSEINDECVKANSPVVFGINLDEPGYCRFDVKRTNNFDEMEYDFGFRNLFLEDHSHFFEVPSLESLGLPGYDPERKANYDFYVRCIDSNGNGKDSREYNIGMCVKPGLDNDSPKIRSREPLNEFVKFDAENLNGVVFTNEPADCKWDVDRNMDYNEMENSMNCENDVQDRSSLFGWECKTEFPITQEENKYYIKCKDQPWYGENWDGEVEPIPPGDESKRNEMNEPYEFVIRRTKTELSIVNVEPNDETFEFGVRPASVDLVVETDGGVDGTAKCSILPVHLGGTRFSEMSKTFGKIHEQRGLNVYFDGDNEYAIQCVDSAGNTAEASSKFSVSLDTDSPKVTRVYDKAGSLIIVTNEESECGFKEFIERGKKACEFEFEDSELMSGSGLRHSTSLDKMSYYVKCKDKWNNAPGECSVIVGKG